MKRRVGNGPWMYQLDFWVICVQMYDFSHFFNVLKSEWQSEQHVYDGDCSLVKNKVTLFP